MSSWAPFLRPASVLVLLLASAAALPASADGQASRKLDRALTARAGTGVGVSKVIVRFQPGADASADAKRLGAAIGRRLRNGAVVMRVPNSQLGALAQHPAVETIRWDRPVSGLPITSQSSQTGASVAQSLGYTGKGIGIAVIDSGITPWHDELTYAGSSPRVLSKGGQRLAEFVDYTQEGPNGEELVLENIPAYDDYGHGTHVAGIIAGNGLGSNGTRMGAAPEAHLVVLKVLDAAGTGSISDVVDAVGYAIAHKEAFNIRVINLSIAARPIDPEEELADELAEATKLAVEAGIVVVAAAGNLGWDSDTLTQQYGGITAPGVYPWVLTVGAYDPQGTATRKDDEVARFSSRGPTAYTYFAKPDLAAPGVGLRSLGDPTSKLYAKMIEKGLLGGPYISLSGTSVATPVVSGTVALMAQAYDTLDRRLTPNLAKGILQFTAWVDPDHDRLSQGAGYMDPQGALTLTRYFANAKAGDRYPIKKEWSGEIIWGTYLMRGGVLWPNGSAWATSTTWGETVDEEGDNIVWGTLCAPEDCDNIVWGTAEDLDNIVWGTDEDGDNIVWGTRCGDGADDDEDCDNIVWGTTTEDGDNIVWGTCADEDCDNIVWGTCEDCDNIVWGTLEDIDNIVWGTACNGEDCDNIVWGTAEDGDNIVWGTMCTATACDWNIVWGTVFGDTPGVSGMECSSEECDNIVWGTSVTRAPTAPQPGNAGKRTVKRDQARGSSRR